MSLKSAIEAAKHLVVDDEGEDQKPTPTPKGKTSAAPAPAFHFSDFANPPAAPVGQFPVSGASPFAVPTAVVVDESVYQNILKKTNFDDTPVGKTVHRYFDALDGVIPDTTQRFKAAIGQAQKLDGIAPDAILQAFDSMQAALDKDCMAFSTTASNVESREITARQTKIQDLTTQVTNLNAQIAQLQGELTDATSHHSSIVSQYGVAQQRRATEIAQQKQQFANLLR